MLTDSDDTILYAYDYESNTRGIMYASATHSDSNTVLDSSSSEALVTYPQILMTVVKCSHNL